MSTKAVDGLAEESCVRPPHIQHGAASPRNEGSKTGSRMSFTTRAALAFALVAAISVILCALILVPTGQVRFVALANTFIAVAVAVILAVTVGMIFSSRLTSSLKRITRTAQRIKEGDLTARTELTGKDEISELGEMFDEMADSIERDRELERRLTTDVAHELRTPLMGIQATTEAIMDGIYPADDERMNAIRSETTRLKRLVEALLNLSRLESGSVPFNAHTMDCRELMRELVLSHEALFESDELSIRFEADNEPVMVDGDSDMLRQAVTNLISNAVRYNKPGGEVVVRVSSRDGQWAEISVSDTGIGISPEDQAMVFSRFWRAEEGRNRASGGLGVGLSVVKELVDYHAGKIEIESELGQGTTFTILIPLHISDENAESKEKRRNWTGKIHRVK